MQPPGGERAARQDGYGGLLEVLPLGVDATTLSAGDQRHDDETWTLLLVGRLVPEKGVREAVEVLARVRQVRPARLVVVGRGPVGDAVPALARELGVTDHVELVPWVDAEALAALYRRAHVALLPSRATRTWVEQFGRVITEGLASGAVVVGWASGSIPTGCWGCLPTGGGTTTCGPARSPGPSSWLGPMSGVGRRRSTSGPRCGPRAGRCGRIGLPLSGSSGRPCRWPVVAAPPPCPSCGDTRVSRALGKGLDLLAQLLPAVREEK